MPPKKKAVYSFLRDFFKISVVRSTPETFSPISLLFITISTITLKNNNIFISLLLYFFACYK